MSQTNLLCFVGSRCSSYPHKLFSVSNYPSTDTIKRNVGTSRNCQLTIEITFLCNNEMDMIKAPSFYSVGFRRCLNVQILFSKKFHTEH